MSLHAPSLGRAQPVSPAVPEPAPAAPVDHEAAARPLVGRLLTANTATFSATALGATLLLAHEGGYFPTSWGWTALALAWAAALGAVLSRRLRTSRYVLAFVGALGALAVWTGLSYLWSDSGFRAVLETQRVVVYLALATAVVVLVRRTTVSAFLAGVLTAVTLVATYGLATRLLPERFGTYDPVATYRLAEPLGYWNAVGMMAVLGLLLAAGLSLRAGSIGARALGGACLPILATTLYFTFGRGSWIALAAGVAVAVAVDPRRLQLCAGLLALAVPTAACIALATRADALSRQGAELADATRSGHRLALALLVMTLVTAGVAAAFALAERRLHVSRLLRRGFATALLALLVFAAVAGWARFGSPPTAVVDAYDAFTAPPPKVAADLDARLLSFSGNGRAELWRVAVDTGLQAPVLGSGAGSYELAWLERRPNSLKVRDAHSLYLETFAELGAVGLALLLVALAVPLAASWRARRQPLVPAALGAYAAYLLHAGADWDWEMTGLTATALCCAAALVVSAPGRAHVARARTRIALVGISVAIVAVGLPGLLSASGLAGGGAAAKSADWSTAEREARQASRFAPWSPAPWQAVGEARLASGDRTGARESFEHAIEIAPREWMLWFDLARSLDGAEQAAALAEAEALNPKSPEIAQLRAESGGITASVEGAPTAPEDVP